MLLKSVAHRYAQALYGLAKDTKSVDEQLLELYKVAEICRSNDQLSRALASPTIPAAVKKSILRRLLEKRVKARTLHFFYVLVDKNREVYVDAIIEAFKQIMRDARGEVEITVQLPFEPEKGFEDKLRTTLEKHTGKKVGFKIEQVPELLGGVVILIGDRIIDGSLRSQLEKLQQQLSNAQVASVGG